jgi:hypothetical protein
MAQDFWASSGFHELEPTAAGLKPTAAWLRRFFSRDELQPPPEAGPRERAMHARLSRDPLAAVAPEALQAVEDADARENWAEFLRFRERVLAFPTLEACYRDLFARPQVDLAPPFVDAMVHAIVRASLEGTDDPFVCRAGEMLFRRQRVSAEEGRVLSADAATIEVYAETGGFGEVGRLLQQQGTPMPAVKMDVLNAENAPFYWMRDELYSFVLDLAPASAGAAAMAKVLERWVARMAGAAVTIEPVARIDDERWRWHVGLDVEATALLNALYRGEPVAPEDLERLVLLFRLEFRDARDMRADVAGRPVYLGLACRADRSLKVKPQNLVLDLPLARPAVPRG